MENKKTFVENDLQAFCKKIDTSIDKIVYEESKYYQNETVIIFYKDGRKVVTNVTGAGYGMTAYDVIEGLVRMLCTMYQERFKTNKGNGEKEVSQKWTSLQQYFTRLYI